MPTNDKSGPPTSARVRRADPADVPALVSLNLHVQRLHADLYPADFEAAPDDDELTRFFLAIVTSGNQAVGILEGSEGPLGYIAIEERERAASPFMTPSRVLHIHHIAVEPGARRAGIGSALMAWAEQQARSSGIGQILVEHWAGNEDARRFFARRGFEEVRITMRKSLPGAG